MKNSEIIDILKGNEVITIEVAEAFQSADQEQNFSWKFGKTKKYWNKKEWNTVANEVKKAMKS